MIKLLTNPQWFRHVGNMNMKNIPDMKKWFNGKGLLICRGFLLWVASFGTGAEEAMSRAQ